MCHEPAMMNVVVGMHDETVSNVHVYMNHVNVALYVCMCKIRLRLIISKSMTRTTPWRPHIKDDWPRNEPGDKAQFCRDEEKGREV